MLKNVKRFDEMNVIPFIDIMLVLLAIVLTTATFINQGLIPVNLAQTENAEANAEQIEAITITVDENNQFYWDEQAMPAEQIKTMLGSLSKDQEINLRIDKVASFEPFTQLVDWFQTYGLANIYLQTEQK